MESILLEQEATPDPSQHDLRYFYFNDKGGQSSCGIAFGTLLAIYRKYKDHRSDQHDAWYQAISIAPNPTVLVYLVEFVCLSTIENVGLKIVDPHLDTSLDKEFFRKVPNMMLLLNGRKTRQLYVPSTFNFPNIDAVIVRVDNEAMAAYFYPIQVTIAKVHKNSEADFYREQWAVWKDPFVQKGYKVSSMFVWVNREQPSKEDVPEQTRDVRRRKAIVVEHARQVVTVTIESLDSRLENMIARTPFY